MACSWSQCVGHVARLAVVRSKAVTSAGWAVTDDPPCTVVAVDSVGAHVGDLTLGPNPLTGARACTARTDASHSGRVAAAVVVCAEVRDLTRAADPLRGADARA